MQAPITPQKRFYDMKEVCCLAGISRSTMNRAEKLGFAPKGRRFGARCVRFDREQIDQWLATGSWLPLPWQEQRQ